jgi:outer membrane cobalamin receptor
MALNPAPLIAQAALTVTITVQDSRGAALTGATAMDPAGTLIGRFTADGKITLTCAAACKVRFAAPGFAEKTVQLSADATIQLVPAAAAEQVTVTAYRTPLGSLESPASTRELSQTALNTTASITLDGKMRQLPGVELFRRSSSLVANPSSQGLSLRALGSTAASRTLITEDDVPLNDPFAGWIHWQEQPDLSIERIELVRGGASDLYGSSAIGGVVNIVPVRPSIDQVELRSSYGAEGTNDDSLLLQTKRGPWGLLAAAGIIGTDGYIQEAPYQRGPVYIDSNVHSQSGLVLAEHVQGPLRLFVRTNGFNDARSNGTPDQTNATRLWRYATGGDWQGPHNGVLGMRVYGSTEHSRQVFSSILNTTAAAKLLRVSRTRRKTNLAP